MRKLVLAVLLGVMFASTSFAGVGSKLGLQKFAFGVGPSYIFYSKAEFPQKSSSPGEPVITLSTSVGLGSKASLIGAVNWGLYGSPAFSFENLKRPVSGLVGLRFGFGVK